MIERYSHPEIALKKINTVLAWGEILADRHGLSWENLRKMWLWFVKADFDIDRTEIEQQTRHDVVAFTRAVSETLGEERKWVFVWRLLTVVDTAYGYLHTNKPTISSVRILKTSLTSSLTRQEQIHHHDGSYPRCALNTTTFGLKLATWYSEMKWNIERFWDAAGVEAGYKISGAVGNT